MSSHESEQQATGGGEEGVQSPSTSPLSSSFTSTNGSSHPSPPSSTSSSSTLSPSPLSPASSEQKAVPDGSDPTNLIVNYIPVSLSEEALRGLFAPFGRIERCKLVSERFTGGSLGYGFVKFDSAEAAAAAMAALNGHPLANKRLKVSISRPPDRDKKSNLYISGLPSSYTQADLEALVSPFGGVHEVRLLLDAGRLRCKGVGFAKFSNTRAAVSCIQTLTGTTVDGGAMPLIVKYADTNSDKLRKALAAQAAMNGGGGGGGGAAHLHHQQQQQSLLSAMAAMHYRPQMPSPPQLAALQAQRRSGGPQGFDHGLPYGAAFYPQPPGHGLVAPLLYHPRAHHQQPQPQPPQQSLSSSSLASSSSSASSLSPPLQSSTPPPPLVPLSLSHSPTLPAGPMSGVEFTGVCLFVYHLPLEATEQTLFALFGAYGLVTSAIVMRDKLTNRSKGYGFVNVANNDQAAAAITALNGFQLGNKYLKVQLKK